VFNFGALGECEGEMYPSLLDDFVLIDGKIMEADEGDTETIFGFSFCMSFCISESLFKTNEYIVDCG